MILAILILLLIIVAYILGAQFGYPSFIINLEHKEERMGILSLFEKGDVISAYDFDYGYYSNNDGSWIKEYDVMDNYPELQQISLKCKSGYKSETRTYSYNNPRFNGIEVRCMHVVLPRIKNNKNEGKTENNN